MADYAIPVARRHYANRAAIVADTDIGAQEWVYNEGEKEIGVLHADGTTRDYISAAKLFKDSDGSVVLDTSDGDCQIANGAALKNVAVECFVSFADIGAGILGLSGNNGIHALNSFELKDEIKLDAIKTHTDTSDFDADLVGYNVLKWVPGSAPGVNVKINITTNEDSRQLVLVLCLNAYDLSELEIDTGGSDPADGALIAGDEAAWLYFDGELWWIIHNNY